MRLLPLPPIFLGEPQMPLGSLTRRQFLCIGGAAAAAAFPCGRVAAQGSTQGAGPRVIYRLSLRRRRGSIAAKLHNANFRFATMAAADANRAHAGDKSRIVPIDVSDDEYDRLFASRDSLVADLRQLGGPVRVGDCNRDGQVTINELVRGVNILLEHAEVTECLPFDRRADGRVTVDELVKGVRNALR